MYKLCVYIESASALRAYRASIKAWLAKLLPTYSTELWSVQAKISLQH